MNVYAQNRDITITRQLRVLEQGGTWPDQETTYDYVLRPISAYDSEFPRVAGEGCDEEREPLLNPPKRAESWFFEGSGATCESDGGRWMYVGRMCGDLSEDLVDGEGPMWHDGAGRSSGAGVTSIDPVEGSNLRIWSNASDGTRQTYPLHR